MLRGPGSTWPSGSVDQRRGRGGVWAAPAPASDKCGRRGDGGWLWEGEWERDGWIRFVG